MARGKRQHFRIYYSPNKGFTLKSEHRTLYLASRGKGMGYSAEVPVETKSRVVERLCQEICKLLLQLYMMSSNKLPLKQKLPQKNVSPVDVL